MTIRQRDIGDVAVLDLEGRIVGGTDSEAFQHTLQALVDGGQRKILVNLEHVSWVNSSGLGILISGFTQLRSKGGTLKLLHVSPRVQSLLAVTRLSTLFESYKEEDEALKSFA